MDIQIAGNRLLVDGQYLVRPSQNHLTATLREGGARIQATMSDPAFQAHLLIAYLGNDEEVLTPIARIGLSRMFENVPRALDVEHMRGQKREYWKAVDKMGYAPGVIELQGTGLPDGLHLIIRCPRR